MTDNKMLSQEEIDALLKGAADGGEDPAGPEESPEPATEAPPFDGGGFFVLDGNEKDALGEIGNISMGSASTTLSELLRQKVTITSPRVGVLTQIELFESFKVPYIIIKVQFTAGLIGFNVLVMKLRDAMVMANLMMGGEGEVESEEISDIELSAASEAMNQMIGSACTSLSTMFGRKINISPPNTEVLENPEQADYRLSDEEDSLVVVSFDMKIGDLLETEIMQILSIETAKKEAALLWDTIDGASSPGEDALLEEAAADDEDTWLSKDLWPAGDAGGGGQPVVEGAPVIGEPPGETWVAPEITPPLQERPVPVSSGGFTFTGLTAEEKKKLELLLEVPLKVSVVLGRTRRPIKEVLNLTPGAILELHALVDEPVEVLVNGTLVAKGEVVVVNENFGVRITYIMAPEERLRKIRD